MSAAGGASSPLQFDKAEFSTNLGLSCKVCKSAISDSYFTVNGRAVCPACRESLGDGNRPVTAQGLSLAVVLGILAAVAGAVLWVGFRALFKAKSDLVAAAVGHLIGTAVRRGSGGTGGSLFQGLALIMTYLSIALSFAPAYLDWHIVEVSGLVHSFMAMAILPIVAVGHSILSLIMYGYAFYRAWQLTARAPWVVTGPQRVASARQVAVNG